MGKGLNAGTGKTLAITLRWGRHELCQVFFFYQKTLLKHPKPGPNTCPYPNPDFNLNSNTNPKSNPKWSPNITLTLALTIILLITLTLIWYQILNWKLILIISLILTLALNNYKLKPNPIPNSQPNSHLETLIKSKPDFSFYLNTKPELKLCLTQIFKSKITQTSNPNYTHNVKCNPKLTLTLNLTLKLNSKLAWI